MGITFPPYKVPICVAHAVYCFTQFGVTNTLPYMMPVIPEGYITGTELTACQIYNWYSNNSLPDMMPVIPEGYIAGRALTAYQI